MSHRFFSERSVIERGRSCGCDHGAKGLSYRTLQHELRTFSGCSLEQVEALAENFETPQRISNGFAREVYRNRGESLDKLSALKRFFDSYVGKTWSIVLSRLRTASNRRPDSYEHMLTHLQQLVEVSPHFENGYPCINFSESRGFLRPLTAGAFYVDQNGLLKKIYDSCYIDRRIQYEFPYLNQFVYLNRMEFFKYSGIKPVKMREYSGLRLGSWYKVNRFTVTRAHKEVVRDSDGQLKWTANGPEVRTVLKELPCAEIVPASDSEIRQLEQSC